MYFLNMHSLICFPLVLLLSFLFGSGSLNVKSETVFIYKYRGAVFVCHVYSVSGLLLMWMLGKWWFMCLLIYTNKAKRNLFVCLLACLSGMAGHALYGMAPCFGHTGVTFDAENDWPGPSSL